MAAAGARSERRHLVAGALLLPLLWEGLAHTPVLAGAVPPISAVFAALFLDGDLGVYLHAAGFTAANAGLGYLLGAAIGSGMGVTALLVPVLRRGIVRFGALLNATPVIALGPILLATVPRDGLPVAVSAFFVFFSVLVALLRGFDETSPHLHDVLSVLGVDRRRRFLHLELPNALPTLIAGLKVAAPAAVVGSVFGEWFGLDQGLGPIMISSMQNYALAALWAATLLAGGLGVLVYLLLSVAERRIAARYR